ncbi:MAG TPA: ketopantoate reductase C-terminal domain-containing protein, partial [Bacillota bacterium]|nr:ketopantoate reductase C-terminal domain-containing protein [Bacillota bacterium]
LIKVASYSGNSETLFNLVHEMDEPSFPFHLYEEWEPLLKEKLIINTVINPLTALFRIKNGYILKVPHIERLAYLLCKEAAFVLNLDFQKAWGKVRAVVDNTGENISSMLSDVNKRRETEIDAITGYILRNSKETIPNTAFIYDAIKAIESLYMTNEE